MKVLKFGGTSVGSAQRIKHVAGLINDGSPKIVVLSAMSGTTNALVDIIACFSQSNLDKANEIISKLEQKYATEIEELYTTLPFKEKALESVVSHFRDIWNFSKSKFSSVQEKEILIKGELISTELFNLYLHETGVNSVLLPALDFMRTSVHAEPDIQYTKEKFSALLAKHPDISLFITQGFICKDAYGSIDNLQRGGSDLSATIIGAAVQAEEIQIWTDIDGMHNNDPRLVSGTAPVRQLNFEEAAKLAYFGAKILHPTCILPAKSFNIPVRLLNTMQPESPGTLITNTAEKRKIKAVAAKDNITFVKLKSNRSIPNHEFLGLIFNTFAKYKTPIDMVTTSEIGVSVTIDNTANLSDITNSLHEFAEIMVDEDMVIICVVGDLEWQNIGFEASIVNALKNIPVRMISYGGSNSNVSLLMKAADKKKALESLSESLFTKNCN